MLIKLLLLSSLLLYIIRCGWCAGLTSAFIRSEWPSVDIPLNNKAFAVPKGYNAPHQALAPSPSRCLSPLKSSSVVFESKEVPGTFYTMLQVCSIVVKALSDIINRSGVEEFSPTESEL